MAECAISVGPPRGDEQAALVAAYGDDHRDVVADERPWQDDVNAFRRPDRVRVCRLVERSHVVGPDSGRDDNGARRDVELLVVLDHGDAVRHTIVIGGDVDNVAPVDDCRAMVGGGARNRECQPSVIGCRIEIEVAGTQLFDVRGGEVLGRDLCRNAPMKLSDAPPAGKVVHPHRRPKSAGHLARHNAVFGQNGDHERQHLHQVRRIAHQSSPLA